MSGESKRRLMKILMIAGGVLVVALLVSLTAYYYNGAQAKAEAAAETPVPVKARAVLPAPTQTPAPMETAPVNERRDGVYTILLVGNDQGNGNTDTVMLARLDTVEHKLNCVSIPRDTLINKPWQIRKLNAVYWGSERGGGEGIEALQKSIRMLTGFEADCYAVMDLDVLVAAVNAIGGIYYDVPLDMDYEDSSQNLYIHIPQGRSLLDGEQVMQLCRFRSAFIDGDLGRIALQQDFLKAAAEQFIKLENIPNAAKLYKILSEGIDTNLSAANMAYLARQLLCCGSDNISFYTAPVEDAEIKGCSYAVLLLDEWLETVNNYISPLSEPITAAQVDIVYKSGGAFRSTSTLTDPGYYSKPVTLSGSHAAEPPAAEAEPEPTDRPNFAAPIE